MARGRKKKADVIRAWVELLVPILQRGTDIKNACIYLKIPYTTFLDYYKKDEAVRVKIDAAKKYLDILAETTIATAIQKGDANSAKWRIERTQKDKYSTKITTEHEGNVDIKITTNVLIPKKK